MREYYTKAFVLDKTPSAEVDHKVILYTEKLGKITAKITSGRKITSKLSGHLEPLNHVEVRLIKKNIFQVADALKSDEMPTSLPVAKAVRTLTLEGEPDPALWAYLRREGTSAAEILTILGFDPELASCAMCGGVEPKFFLLKSESYYCEHCVPRHVHPREYLAL